VRVGRWWSGRGVNEVTAILELLLADEPQISFVDQRRGVERLPRLLVRQFSRREFAQLIVDQRQKLFSGVWVTLINGRQDASNIAHNV
jgi:hypothetical protein